MRRLPSAFEPFAAIPGELGASGREHRPAASASIARRFRRERGVEAGLGSCTKPSCARREAGARAQGSIDEWMHERFAFDRSRFLLTVGEESPCAGTRYL